MMRKSSRRPFTAIFFLTFCLTSSVHAQVSGSQVNYNTNYQYPFSVGLEVQFVSPMAYFGTNYHGDFSLLDVAAQGRFPLPNLPVLQPLAKLGMLTVRAESNPSHTKFDHTRYYLTGGMGYMNKFSKTLELGAEIDLGVGYSVFSNIDSMDAYGAWNFQASVGGRIVFNPSYNISINAHPFIGYNMSFSPLTRFNGVTVGLGITLDYRFGTDPDDPETEIRSIQFKEAQLDNVFAAMQSYYVDNPMGEVTLINTEKYPLTDLKVTFFQPGYMNIATQVMEINQLDPGEEITVPITASFDQNIFTLEGVTPLTGELRVDYTLRTRDAAQTIPITYDLYDKNSLTWDDDRKVAAFITSGDSALANYLSFLRQTTRDVTNPGFSESVQIAMQVYYGLTEIGSIYQRDPTLSYEDAKGNTLLVDSVNLPRETLTKLAGDCDDLTVLFNSLLESAGVETGFITAPGHIYSIFSTGIPAKDYRLLHPEKTMTVAIDGVLWLPLEITLIGESDFEVAWRVGAEEFVRFVDDGDKLGLYFTQESQAVYRPVSYEERDLGLQYGDRAKIVRDFKSSLDSTARLVIDDYERIAREDNSKGSWNQLGIVSAKFEEYVVAESALFSSLALDRNYLPAKINLANVYFKQDEFQNALRLYHEAEEHLRENGQTQSSSYARLLLNISQTYNEVENFEQAAYYSEMLKEINPQLADLYSYMYDADKRSGTRAADLTILVDILFIEE